MIDYLWLIWLILWGDPPAINSYISPTSTLAWAAASKILMRKKDNIKNREAWAKMVNAVGANIFHSRAFPRDIIFRLGIGQMLPLHAVLVFKSNKRGEVLEPTTKILEIVWSCRIFMEILWKGEKSEVEGNVNICHSLSTIWVCHPPTHIELPTVYTLHGESQMFAFAHCVSLNSVYIIATRYYKDILPLPLLLVSSSVYIVSTKWWRSYLGTP